MSRHALARVDVDKLRLAAETQENWLPFVLGPMMLRVWTVTGDAEVLVTRAAVTTAIVNGDFSAGGGWDLASGTTAGATSLIANNVLTLTCSAVGGHARCTQQIASGLVDIGKPHAVRIVVAHGLRQGDAQSRARGISCAADSGPGSWRLQAAPGQREGVP